jgi:hypothetical protein
MKEIVKKKVDHTRNRIVVKHSRDASSVSRTREAKVKAQQLKQRECGCVLCVRAARFLKADDYCKVADKECKGGDRTERSPADSPPAGTELMGCSYTQVKVKGGILDVVSVSPHTLLSIQMFPKDNS